MESLKAYSTAQTPQIIRPHDISPIAVIRCPHHALGQRNCGGPNQVWATDITYIPMRRGFVYLAAVMDWATRRVLSWRVSNTLTTDFCLDAVREAIARHGCPEIFNTDQGCQFTSIEFTGLLKEHGIQLSMDGKGCWRDNVFVERLWKSVKYEEVYLRAYDSVSEAKAHLGRYFHFYNGRRPHQSLDAKTPMRFTSTTCRRKNSRHDGCKAPLI